MAYIRETKVSLPTYRWMDSNSVTLYVMSVCSWLGRSCDKRTSLLLITSALTFTLLLSGWSILIASIKSRWSLSTM